MVNQNVVKYLNLIVLRTPPKCMTKHGVGFKLADNLFGVGNASRYDSQPPADLTDGQIAPLSVIVVQVLHGVAKIQRFFD